MEVVTNGFSKNQYNEVKAKRDFVDPSYLTQNGKIEL